MYCKKNCRNDIDELNDACIKFIDSVQSFDQSLLNKPKFHLFLHLPKCIEEFGGIACFNSERYSKIIIVIKDNNLFLL